MNKMELLLERQRGNMDGISPSSVRCCNSIFEFKYLSWTRSGLYDRDSIPLRESLSISRETFPTDFSVERKKKRKEKERRRERRERREAN